MNINYELQPSGLGDSELAPIVRQATDMLDIYLNNTRQAEDSRVLRDKQIDVMQDLRDFLATHPNDPYGYISLPTGVGKTVLFTELVKATGLRTLVLTPTKILLGQTESTFNKFSDEEIVVGKVFSGEKNADENITLTTYASFVRHTKDKDTGLIAPGQHHLIILDEAHRALAPGTRKALSEYGDAIQIGFTATEEYSDRHKLESLLPVEIHKMTIREAVDERLIAPFTNLIVETDIDVSNVRVTAMNEYDASDLEKVLNTEARNKVALNLYLRYFKGMKALIFCNGVAHAKAVADLFESANVTALAVHGGLDTTMQNLAKEAFARHRGNGVDVLTNDKILTEGFDAPEATVCINLSPTLSRVRAKQRSGRILRLDPNDSRKHAYIIDVIDQQYRKAPVLFSDPKIAEQARVGDQTHSIFIDELSDIEVEGARIITNPMVVAKKAGEFFESHGIERRFAPEGWLSVGQICVLYDVNKQGARAELNTIATGYSDKYGEFHNSRTKSRTTHYHFHPDIVRAFTISRTMQHIDFQKTFPRGWVTNVALAEQYPSKVLGSMFHSTRVMHGGLIADHIITSRGVDYYSPQLERVLRRSAKPNGSWLPVDPLCARFNVNEETIEELCKELSRRERDLENVRPYWYLINNQVEMYISPAAYPELETALREKVTLRKEQAELNPVEPTASRNISEIDLLFSLFNDEQHSFKPTGLMVLNALRREHHGKSDLDAIYELFT